MCRIENLLKEFTSKSVVFSKFFENILIRRVVRTYLALFRKGFAGK